MRVTVIGANGKVGRRTLRLLVADGHDVVGMVRSEAQVSDVEAAGARAVVADLLLDAGSALEGAEAAVFAAGAPFGGDPDAIDADACIAAQRRAVTSGVRRWVQVSSLLADRVDVAPPPLVPFLKAKRRSDDAAAESGLAWTVIRPAGLNDEPGTGLVEVGTGLTSVSLPRDDVAAVAAACVTFDLAVGKAFDVVAGSRPLGEALRSI